MNSDDAAAGGVAFALVCGVIALALLTILGGLAWAVMAIK